MFAAAFLPILLFGMFALFPDAVIGGDDDDDPVDPTEPTDPVDPIDPIDPTDPVDPVEPDTGATFDRSDDGVTIEFGEDETGRLAIFTYEEAETFDGVEVHEIRYYLVPEGVEWPDNDAESSGRIPGEADGNFVSDMDGFAVLYGMTLLGTIDLFAQGNDTPVRTDMAAAQPPLTSNVDPDYYYLQASADGGLVTFLQEGWDDIPTAITIATDGGEPAQVEPNQFGRLSGTDGDDVIFAAPGSTPDLTVLLEDGDDEATVNLQQSVRARDFDGDDEGSDRITLVASADDIEALRQEGAAAESPVDLPDTSGILVGPTDTLELQIDDAAEGRLVQISYTEYSFGGSSQEPVSTDYISYFLVPDGVDVQARIDQYNASNSPEEDASELELFDGAVRLATVVLGGTSTSFDSSTGESTTTDTRFDWSGFSANRSVEEFSFSNTPL